MGPENEVENKASLGTICHVLTVIGMS